MSTLTVELQIPSDAITWLNVSKAELPSALQKLIALELFREGHISAGKGAEILGVSKWNFIQLLAKHEISYVDLTEDELLADLATMKQFLDDKNQ